MGDSARSDHLALKDEQFVRLADYPQLQSIAWSLRPDAKISELDALSLYERNWRHVGELGEYEKGFVQYLADRYSSGRLLV
ncbi:hypothetical protein AB0P23_14280 [Rhodococcus sp. NPDC077669]|uniref:hypothetical protein n=1 Tax=Rhodococcus sp. NPDC077669 TaxID=3155174 RepID=UPI00341C08B0